MRLSSRLSDKGENHGEIESFIDWDKYTTSPEEETEDIRLISAGDFIEIQIGKIILPFYSTVCQDSVSFVSPRKLHCLFINNQMISIDCELQCMDYEKDNPACKECNHCVQAWFLVGADDIFSATPNVYVIKQNFKLPEQIKLPIETEDKFSEWLGKAEIAHKERLGAGSIIYLRSILEQITIEVGKNAGADIYPKGKTEGRTKPFAQVLKAVDEKCAIIPVIYSDNGYKLFQKLSEIAHGNADEETALREYEPLRRLVVGIMDNVKKKEEELKNNAEIKKALDAIGFSSGGEGE